MLVLEVPLTTLPYLNRLVYVGLGLDAASAFLWSVCLDKTISHFPVLPKIHQYSALCAEDDQVLSLRKGPSVLESSGRIWNADSAGFYAESSCWCGAGYPILRLTGHQQD